MVQVGDEGDAFANHERYKRGTYHQTALLSSLETLKNSTQHLFQPTFHFPVLGALGGLRIVPQAKKSYFLPSDLRRNSLLP